MKQTISGYKMLPVGKIRPEGWLRKQLELQAAGITGQLDKVWTEVSDKSAWLGGKGEAWELGPYYMDGLVHLAYILDDAALIAKSEKWISAVLASGRDDGDFGPTRTRDWWPKAPATKALVGYYEATEDPRIPVFLRKFFKFMYNTIDENPPKLWAAARMYEFLFPIKFLKNLTGDFFLDELVEKIKFYAMDWFKFFDNLKFRRPAKTYLNRTLLRIGVGLMAKRDYKNKHGVKPLKTQPAGKILRFNRRRIVKKHMYSHGVNVAMALKYPVLMAEYFDDNTLLNYTKKGLNSLLKYHGTALGIFTCDEHLDGTSPSKGIELCAVAEYMLSLETAMRITGDGGYADLLELSAFNAYPAMMTPDMCCHQYVQQVNQISSTEDKRDFFDVGREGNVFALSPNYSCCTANLGQAMPKFTQNLCYTASDDELVFMTYAPCSVSAKIGNSEITVKESTSYPFDNVIDFDFAFRGNGPEIKLVFRVPEKSALTVFLNGKKIASESKGFIRIQRTLKQGDNVRLVIDNEPVAVINPDKTVSIRKGPLLMAYKLKEKVSVTGGKAPFNSYNILTQTQWRVMPELDSGKPQILETVTREIPEKPFDTALPPLEIHVKGRLVTNWNEVKSSADVPPVKPIVGDAVVRLVLVPYGCTNIRMAQFPVKHK